MFSPNTNCIVSGSINGAVKMWDALSGEQLGSMLKQHKEPIYGLVFSNDGSMLMLASKDQTVIV